MKETKAKFKVGDKVKLNPEIEEFKYGKGYAEYYDIGKIVSINDEDIYVNFPGDDYWRGLENEIIKVNIDFIREDLKFGDIVTLRNGERYVIADGSLYGEQEEYSYDGTTIDLVFDNDLTNRSNEELYIIKVERVGKIIFEREKEEIKEMTIAEISKALGYEVKIVKESSNNDEQNI